MKKQYKKVYKKGGSRRTMNKKGSFMAFVTRAFLIGILIFAFMTAFGLGGGLEAAYKAGAVAKQIPGWFWILLAVLWLFTAMRGK